MMLLIPIIVLLLFVFYEYKRYKNGKFNSCDIAENELHKFLFILPVIHIIVAVFFTVIMNELDYEYPTLGIILIVVTALYLLVNIVVLNKKSLPVKFCVIYTIVISMTFIIAILYEVYTGVFYDPVDYLIALIVIVHIVLAFMLILQFLYIRWIYFYYGLHSPFGQEQVINNDIPTETKQNQHKADDSIDNMNNKANSLRELKQMLDDGILTQEEFDTEKNKILNQ